MQHPIGGIEFLVWVICMTHDECVGSWNHPPHHSKIVPYKHHPLHPLHLLFVFPLVPDEEKGVKHPVKFLCFGPMSGSDSRGLWHCVLSIFATFTILWSMEWPALDYHKYLVFINENRKKVSRCLSSWHNT